MNSDRWRASWDYLIVVIDHVSAAENIFCSFTNQTTDVREGITAENLPKIALASKGTSQ